MATPNQPSPPAGQSGRLPRWTDEQVELVVGTLLRWGVLVAAAVAVAGAALYLYQHGTTRADYHAFRGAPAMLRSIDGILRGVGAADSRAIVQLGLLLLIATPVARVALSLFAFAKQGDRTYVAITAIVLALLLYGLIGGKGG